MKRRIGDVVGRVVDADLTAVLAAPHGIPAGGRGRQRLGVVRQQIRASAVRHAVRLSVERVVGLVLETVEDVLVVRDQVDVHRCHITRRHEADRRVPGERAAVIVARLQQRHPVGRVGHVGRADLAAGLRFERRDPVEVGVECAPLRVSRPDHELELTLAGTERRLRRPLGRAAAARTRRQHECRSARKRKESPTPHPCSSSSMTG